MMAEAKPISPSTKGKLVTIHIIVVGFVLFLFCLLLLFRAGVVVDRGFFLLLNNYNRLDHSCLTLFFLFVCFFLSFFFSFFLISFSIYFFIYLFFYYNFFFACHSFPKCKKKLQLRTLFIYFKLIVYLFLMKTYS